MEKLSRKQAIYEMCRQCIYDPESEGGWRQQCWNCKSDGKDGRSLCPLFQFRPQPIKSTEEEK